MAHPFDSTGYMPPKVVDKRNFILEKAQAVAPFPASYKTDISMIPVFDQKKIPDCVENSITFVKKYHESKSVSPAPDLSRRFLATWTVIRDGFPISEGTSVQNALYEAHKRGICESQFLADDHTLDEKTFTDSVKLTPLANANGVKHTIENYAFLSDTSANGLKNAIYQNGLVVVGALINQNWWTDANGNVSWDAKDILPIRPPTTKDASVDTTLSGHAFVLYGYDETYFYFVNSFSTDWGQGGKGYFGVNEVPFIYEAATIVDLSPQTVQAITQQTQQAIKIEQQIKPTDTNYHQEQGLLAQIFQVILQEIKDALGWG